MHGRPQTPLKQLRQLGIYRLEGIFTTAGFPIYFRYRIQQGLHRKLEIFRLSIQILFALDS